VSPQGGTVNSLVPRVFRETFGENGIQLEITSSTTLATLQHLRERISDQAVEPSPGSG
jgi:hypothetical protein